MDQLELELMVPDSSYRGVVVQENPYVKILGDIRWSMKANSLVSLAQVENSLCLISLKKISNG